MVQGCAHVWKPGTFRLVCKYCGETDLSKMLASARPSTLPGEHSAMWRGKVRMCWKRDGEGCFYCRCPLSIEEARLDHFIPRSKGGPDGLDNRRAACKPCDVRKRNRWPWEFMPSRFDPDPVLLAAFEAKSIDGDASAA